MNLWGKPLTSEYVIANSYVDRETGCWIWRRIDARLGYGKHFWVDGREERPHRAVYRLFVGPITDGLQIDHSCHNADPTCPGGACRHRGCVNPAHLRAATIAENLRASRLTLPGMNLVKTHCKHGHPFDGPNLYLTERGYRKCRRCHASETARRRKAA